MKITLKYFDVLSLLIVVLCMDIPYVNQSMPSLPNLFFYGRMGMLCTLLILCIWKQRKVTKSSILLSCFVALEIVMTKINGYDLVHCFRAFSVSYLIALYLELFYQKRVRILWMWNVFLTLLAMINLGTMLLYPGGLYHGALYSNIWFLGYKTQMYVYLLPWCLVNAYLEATKKGKLTYLSGIPVVLSAWMLWMAEATAAMACTLLVGALYVLFEYERALFAERVGKMYYQLLRPQLVVPAILIVTTMVMMIEKISFVAYFVENILNKDATLTTRTGIWERLLKKVAEKPLFGYGFLKAEQYTVFAKNTYATNAHNTLLSILITVGIVGFCLYLWMVYSSMKRKSKSYLLQEAVFVAGMISFLIVGITSSTCAFCPYAFFWYVMLAVEKKERPDEKPKKKRTLAINKQQIAGAVISK